MAKQREKVEYRYYEIPEGEAVLALLGEDWIREYGKQIKFLHFHNLLEIGYCHWGSGEVVLGQEHIPFSGDHLWWFLPGFPIPRAAIMGQRDFGNGCMLTWISWSLT